MGCFVQIGFSKLVLLHLKTPFKRSQFITVRNGITVVILLDGCISQFQG